MCETDMRISEIITQFHQVDNSLFFNRSHCEPQFLVLSSGTPGFFHSFNPSVVFDSLVLEKVHLLAHLNSDEFNVFSQLLICFSFVEPVYEINILVVLSCFFLHVIRIFSVRTDYCFT